MHLPTLLLDKDVTISLGVVARVAKLAIVSRVQEAAFGIEQNALERGLATFLVFCE